MSIQLHRPGHRAQYLFLALPPTQRPAIADNPALCPHGVFRFFNMDLGRAEPARFGDVYAYLPCHSCAISNAPSNRTLYGTTLNSLSDGERASLRIRMAEYDAADEDQRAVLRNNLRATPNYEPEPMPSLQSREIEIHLYIEAEQAAIIDKTTVQDISCFTFRDTPLFELSHAGGKPPTEYELYLLPQDIFTEDSATLGTLDISKLGHIIIYRKKGMRDWDCRDLFELRMNLQERYYGAGIVNSQAEDAEIVDLTYDSDADWEEEEE
ncbi:hypothetical protein B0H11DRAFT_2239729 [Mycena galericulata]|nr:hypothetical protein B0H11DRAFT_2239729 [Mycena galericulata]